MAKRAVITGITGQDGSYLAELLLEKGYEVTGVVRRLSASNFWRIEHLLDRIVLRPADLLDQLSLLRVIEDVRPHEVYNLAAMSFVPASWDQPMLTGEFNAQGVTRVLEAVRRVDPGIRIYQASSSEMYGRVREVPQTELTPFYPPQPVRRVQSVRSLHHGELPRELRPVRGVGHPVQPRVAAPWTRIRDAQSHRWRRPYQAASPVSWARQELGLGNLDACRDWGFAGDYVRAMWLMLQQDTADDYVIATGISHSVQQLVECAFGHAGLDWRKHVRVDPAFLRPAEIDHLIGDAGKARRKLGWEPVVAFETLITMMVDADLARLTGQPARADVAR